MPSILGANTLSSGYDVANSLRFDGNGDSLSKQISGVNTTKLTISFWFKVCNIDGTYGNMLFSSENNSSDYLAIHQNTSGNLDIQMTGTANRRITNARYTDRSAWYHLVVAFDSTQGTASNRIKVYVNGTQVTSFGTSTDGMSEDSNLSPIDETLTYAVGTYQGQHANYSVDGYMAEFVALYGQALGPTSFGEFDEDSPQIWKPISVSGLTFGGNSFYLDFEDSSALGGDVSGNDNDFTVNNLTAVDQTTDTCTNNFATMNPLDNFYQGATFSEGNCRVVTGSSPVTWNTSTFGLNSGKWYMEATIIDGGSGGSTLIGIADRVTVAAAQELGGLATTYAYLSSGNFRTGDSNTSNSVSATDGDIIGVALDLDSGQNTISYYKNNTLIVAAQNITAPVSGNYFIASGVWLDNDTGTTDHNFGNPVVAHSSAASDANGYGSFEYAPPNGYYAICTKNIAQYG